MIRSPFFRGTPPGPVARPVPRTRWSCRISKVQAPVAQLGEGRLPRSGKAGHGSARDERHEPAGEWPDSRSVGDERSTAAVRSAAAVSHNRVHPETTVLAPVAQLDRVLPSEGRGHRFESCRARQIHTLIPVKPGRVGQGVRRPLPRPGARGARHATGVWRKEDPGRARVWSGVQGRTCERMHASRLVGAVLAGRKICRIASVG